MCRKDSWFKHSFVLNFLSYRIARLFDSFVPSRSMIESTTSILQSTIMTIVVIILHGDLCGNSLHCTWLIHLFRSSVRKDLMAACFVCQSVSQLLVHAFCVVHIFLTQRRIRFICGVLMPCSKGDKMWVGMLGSKVIKGVLLDETIRSVC